MKYEAIFQELEKHGDQAQAEKMSAYMQNLFPFLGIPKPKLKELEKALLAPLKKEKTIDWVFIDCCWVKDYREAQYLALDYLKTKAKLLNDTDLPRLKQLIVNKSWWETVDTIDAYVGLIVLKNKNLEQEMLAWSRSDNLWLRRVSINFQQEYKELTNTDLFEEIIVDNLGTTEFFINKAIGWSLRDYSKTNPDWVAYFLEKYHDKLSALTLKEAGKYLST